MDVKIVGDIHSLTREELLSCFAFRDRETGVTYNWAELEAAGFHICIPDEVLQDMVKNIADNVTYEILYGPPVKAEDVICIGKSLAEGFKDGFCDKDDAPRINKPNPIYVPPHIARREKWRK